MWNGFPDGERRMLRIENLPNYSIEDTVSARLLGWGRFSTEDIEHMQVLKVRDVFEEVQTGSFVFY